MGLSGGRGSDAQSQGSLVFRVARIGGFQKNNHPISTLAKDILSRSAELTPKPVEGRLLRLWHRKTRSRSSFDKLRMISR
jgi:hypothetical protein